MIEIFLFFFAALFVLVKSSDLFVSSASRLAKILGIPELIIGLTIVAIGTSLPEFASSVAASYYHNSGLAVGNIIGSNIANIALILGVSGIIHTLKIDKSLFERECYILIGVTILFYILALDSVISFFDSLILIFLFIAYMLFMFKFKLQFQELFKVKMYIEHISNLRHFLHLFKENFKKILIVESFVLVISLIGLIFGANFVVEYAVKIAEYFSFSQTFIGVTLIALGTSLPELMVALVSLQKGFHNMLIGNIVGSNIFNILFVGGFAAFVNPLDVSEFTLYILGPFMVVVSAVFMLFAWSDLQIKKSEGIVLLLIYLLFLVMILPK
ncbi:MAG: sodium:proton exchanger [Candidatus Diapherotrites archaeon CG10_big_fil_rev_8_21_14_0_10_31_34]|nr:MAG: sodium:proton exchanger [Candidatus Diapherotrites archaeon CG10_big_fil_rev_8_21_14_0_10_31_34]